MKLQVGTSRNLRLTDALFGFVLWAVRMRLESWLHSREEEIGRMTRTFAVNQPMSAQVG